jgi:hypothetical protein
MPPLGSTRAFRAFLVTFALASPTALLSVS